MDLPPGVSSDAAQSPTSGRPKSGPLSARAQQIEKMMDACALGHQPECEQVKKIQATCGVRANWETPDCEAFREYMASWKRDVDSNVVKAGQNKTELCARGDQNECRLAACSMHVITSGTDSDVRQCSKTVGLPSGNTWAIIEQGESSESTRYAVVCLQSITARNAFGAEASYRVPASVLKFKAPLSNEPGKQGYVAAVRNGGSFGTVGEAAAAACEEKVSYCRSQAAASGNAFSRCLTD
jgi:hypothetical protein